MKCRKLLLCKRLLIAFILGIVLTGKAQVVEMLKDINPGLNNSSSVYNAMTSFNGKFFFTADDGFHGMELWVSDGTEVGTTLLIDIYPGTISSEAGWAKNFAVCNNSLFFVAKDGTGDASLWATDGTADGTYKVDGEEYVSSYGSPNALYTYNGKVYFSAREGVNVNGAELWCSDGTAEGTYVVKDIRPGSGGSIPKNFQEYNGKLYFEAYDGGQGVDGAHSSELWVTDGTEVGTHIVKDIASEQYGYGPKNLTVFNGELFFTTEEGEYGIELWATDGTEEGTHLVKDIWPGMSGDNPLSSYPRELTVFNETLFFIAQDEDEYCLWKSDGTEEGTVKVSVDVHFYMSNPSRIAANFTNYGDQLIFTAYEAGDDYRNSELYAWTEENGIQLIKEINPDPVWGCVWDRYEGFVRYKDKLYFGATYNDELHTALWQTDGTLVGTIETPGQDLSQNPDPLDDFGGFSFQVFNGSLYYPALYDLSKGIELYKLTVAPLEIYTMTGGGDYCVQDEGVPVGLLGSEQGVTYTLYRNGVAQPNTIAGTGAAITFGNHQAGTYTVSGSNVAGSLDMDGSAVVNAVTSINVSVTIAADDEEVCSGQAVTYTATPVNGGNNPAYQWYVNGAATGENQPVFSYTPADGDQVHVELTSSFSCAANVGESNILTITVNDLLTPEVSIVASENPVFSADPVTFSPTPVNGGTPSYEWFVNDVLVGTDETYTYLPINEDQVYVVMTSSIECVTSPNATSNVIDMIVNNGIPAAYAVTGGGNYCEGSEGLPVGVSDSETGVLYTLYKDDVAQEPAIEGTGEAISFGNRLDGTYTVTGTNATTTTTMAGSAVIVEIENLPVSVSIEPEEEPFCSMSEAVFYATVENGGNDPTYQWYKNGIGVTGNNYNYYSFWPEDGDEVYVEVTSSIECTVNNPVISNVYELEVITSSMPQVTLVVDNDQVCRGESVTFTATPASAGETPTYTWWLNGGGYLGTTTEPTLTITPDPEPGYDFIYVTVHISPDPDLQCVVGSGLMESPPVYIYVSETLTPAISITASANPSFIGYPVTFTLTPVNGGDDPSYEWYVNNELVGTDDVYEYEPEDGDLVSAIMISSYECATSQAVLSNLIVMTMIEDVPHIGINTTSLIQTISIPNGQATDYLSIENTGDGELLWDATVEYLGPYTSVSVPEGPAVQPFEPVLTTAGNGSGTSPMAKDRETVVLNYDHDNYDAIGLISGGTFHVAARFPSDMTLPYAGYELESVDVFIYDAITSAALKIWDAGTTTTPGTLLHEQSFSGAGWVTITLAEPVEITGNDIWVGYSVTHAAGTNPAGIDGGPANANGDWISTDGTSWGHLADLGYSANWNIRANLTGVNYGWLSLDPDGGTIEANELQDIQVNYDALDLPVNETYTANILISSNDPETPVLTIPVTMALTVGVEEAVKSQIQVYPNPASDVIHITNMVGVRNIRMINSLGQLVLEEQITDQDSRVLGTAKLQSGIYQLQFRYLDGNVEHKTIVISK